MLEIIIPMAGEGRRFAEAGYTQPKPLIDIHGRTMIDRVMDSLKPACQYRFRLLTQTVVGRTHGAADTILRAESLVTPTNPVMVANCDQYLDTNINEYLAASQGYDASIMIFNSTNPHHSYVKLDGDLVSQIVEKRVISDNAVVGVYWFETASLLMKYAAETVDHGTRHNGEFYISAIIDLMVRDGLRICAYELRVGEYAMLGTPEELRIFLDKIEDGRVKL